jgi:hypothetical protein
MDFLTLYNAGQGYARTYMRQYNKLDSLTFAVAWSTGGTFLTDKGCN